MYDIDKSWNMNQLYLYSVAVQLMKVNEVLSDGELSKGYHSLQALFGTTSFKFTEEECNEMSASFDSFIEQSRVSSDLLSVGKILGEIHRKLVNLLYKNGLIQLDNNTKTPVEEVSDDY